MFNEGPLGIKDLVKFPFLKESMNLIREKMKELHIEDLDKEQFSALIKKVERRVILSIKNGVAPIFDDMYIDVYSELLSFFISMIIIKATDDQHIISRYSLAEARRAEELLKNELKGDEASYSILEYVFRSVTGSKIYKSERPLLFKLHFTDYLKFTSYFQSPSWKLTNRILDGGFVYLRDREIVRLVREAVYRHLFSKISSFPTPILSPKLKEIVEKVKKIKPKIKIKKMEVSIKDFPPCINRILSKIEQGENVSHFGRFFLTTYLLTAGWDVERIIGLFSKMPDFKESIARYQVEHIAGLRGGRKRYSVPSCKLIATYGLCFKDENCRNLKNPIRYRRK